MPTQDEYDVSKQKYRKLFCKIELLDNSLNVIYELKGNVIGEPTFTVDANSDIRRTFGLSLYPTDKSFDIHKGNKIWIDKLVKVYIGIKNNKNDEIVYTNMGVYLIDAPQTTYSAIENTLTISGIDLMAKFTGNRGGYLKAVGYEILSGENVRQTILSVLEMGGFDKTKQICIECPINDGYTPNDINISSGGTLYDILTALKNICPNCQMYFDVDGIFHYELIPSGENEEIYVDDNLWKDTLISYTKETSFNDLKNSVTVFGMTHDIKHFASEEFVNINGDTYELTIPSLEDNVLNDTKIGFVAPKGIISNNIKIKLNEEEPFELLEQGYDKDTNKTTYESPILSKDEDVYYVIKTKGADNYYTIKESQENPTYEAELKVGTNVFYIKNTNMNIVKNGNKILFKTPSSGCEYATNPYIDIPLDKKYVIEPFFTDMEDIAKDFIPKKESYDGILKEYSNKLQNYTTENKKLIVYSAQKNAMKTMYDSAFNTYTEKSNIYNQAVLDRESKYHNPNYIGNVDINHRPLIILDYEKGVFTTSYINTANSFKYYEFGLQSETRYRIVHYTPILQDGTILEQSEIDSYLDMLFDRTANKEKILSDDKYGKKIIYSIEEEYEESYITQRNLNMALSFAETWDLNMKETQNSIYGAEAYALINLQYAEDDLNIKKNSYEISLGNFNNQNSITNTAYDEYLKVKVIYDEKKEEYDDAYSTLKEYRDSIYKSYTISNSKFNDEDNSINVFDESENKIIPTKTYLFDVGTELKESKKIEKVTFNDMNLENTSEDITVYPYVIYKLTYYDGWGNDYEIHEIRQDDGVTPINRLKNDTTYEITYHISDDKQTKYFEFLGELTASSESYENNPQSPFFVKSDIPIYNTNIKIHPLYPMDESGNVGYYLNITSQKYTNKEVKNIFKDGCIGFVAPFEITNKNCNIYLYNNDEIIDEYHIDSFLEEDVIHSGDNCYLYKGKNYICKNNSPCEEIGITLSGSEYDNISTRFLAKNRSNYELYMRCRLNDSITLTCLPIYWLDVNKIVEITLPNKNGIEEKLLYIIKQINTTLSVGATQSITLMRYYPTDNVI